MQTMSFLLNSLSVFHYFNLGIRHSQISFTFAVTRCFDAFTFQQLAFGLLCITFALVMQFPNRPIVRGAPYHGYLSWFEPTYLLQVRYITGARRIISTGYLKVWPNLPCLPFSSLAKLTL